MRHNPAYASDDPEVVRRLIEESPWAILVSHNGGLVASHTPILLDEEAEEITILTHLGKPDDRLHGLGEGEMLAPGDRAAAPARALPAPGARR